MEYANSIFKSHSPSYSSSDLQNDFLVTHRVDLAATKDTALPVFSLDLRCDRSHGIN